MKTNLKIMCMAFDGDTILERPEFCEESEAWEYANDLGSKWYFYPFVFVVTASGKTIKAASEFLEWTVGMRVSTVSKIFEKHSKNPKMQGADCETFIFSI